MSRNKKLKIPTLLLIAGLVGLLSGATAGTFFALTRDLPQIRELENFEPSAVTRIYSADKVLLSELFLEKRTPIPFHKIPSHLKNALIVTEDRQFYLHSGIDLKGILRAIVKDIMAGQFVEGASTITQQLAKTLFLSSEKKISRKIREALLAIQLEKRYTKDEILTLYLNQIYFGSGTYGVESASQRYFGFSASQMNLSQCALIAGLPKAPSRYSPLINPDLAEKRRNLVLRIMHDQRLITGGEYQQAKTEPVLYDQSTTNMGSAPYFVQYIKPALEAAVGPSMLYKGGVTVHTTLSHGLQIAAETALKKGLTELDQRMTPPQEENQSPQGALVAVDVRTGGIVAMVGGKDFSKSSFNRATDARRQSGSAFKPVIYALAITRGYTQATLVLDAPVAFKNGNKKEDWLPENFSKTYQGEITLRQALTHSENIPAVRLVDQLGPSAVVQFAHRLGIDSPLTPNLSIALGTASTNLLELIGAYTVFANGGNHITPFGVTEIIDRHGIVRWQAKPSVRPVISHAQAAIMVDMLQGVVEEGTGTGAKQLKFPVAGKTGTTSAYKDALFVGFSPVIAAGVWVGMDDNTTLGEMETGSRTALPIWVDFMASTSSQASLMYFDIPDKMEKIWMDPISGKLAPHDADDAVQVLFVKGTGPTPPTD